LQVLISSDGTNYDIMTGSVPGVTLAIGQELDIKIEQIKRHDEWVYLVEVDGAIVSAQTSALVPHATTQGWRIGLNATGKARSFRFTKGAYRCGGAHDASGVPFFDTGYFESGTVYSDNPALCGYEFAMNPNYGMGMPVGSDGVISCKAWCDSLLGGTVPRCRISMLIDKVRLSEEWLQVIATYGEFRYAHDAGSLAFVANKPIGADNPSGQELMRSPDFSSSTPYTLDPGLLIDGWNAVVKLFASGSDLTCSQTISTEDGVEYAVRMDSLGMAGGGVTVRVGGVDIFTDESAAGTYTALFTAVGTSSAVEIIFDAAATGAVGALSIRRTKWRVDDWVQGSLSIVPEADSNTPTVTKIVHAVPDGDSASWGTDSQMYSLPGVAEGDIRYSLTTIPMDYVFRSEEAYNKAQSRTLRLYNRVRFSGICKDPGVLFQPGTDIEAHVDAWGLQLDVRADTVVMVAPGRHRVSGYLYSINDFPSELPEGDGSIPVGAVTPLQGDTVESGWSVFSDADGRMIVGAGGLFAPGDEGGATTVAAFTGNTTDGGAHAPSETIKFPVKKVITTTGGVVLQRWDPDSDSLSKGVHNHSYDTGIVTPSIYRRENILIQKTGTASSVFPANAMVFGLNGLTVGNLVRSTAYQGRLLKAASASINAGLPNQFISFTSGTTDDTHLHHSENTFSNQTTEIDFDNEWFEPEEGGAPHNHDFTLALERNIKRFRLALYAGTGEFTVAPGVMMFWPLSLGAIPAPWYLCDGSNGTPDLRDFFIEIASQGNEETSAGDNTVSFSGEGTPVPHDHDGNRSVEGVKTINIGHVSREHTHSVSGSAPFTPQYHALGVMMYNP
jgi:hypothetical protein